MKGTLVNAGVVLAGAAAGTLLRSGIPERYRETLIAGLGLAVGLIGLQMAAKTENVMIVILSLVVGGIIGEALEIEGRLNQLGEWLGGKIGKRFGDISQGFVTATLVYCVGAMAIIGSIQDGIAGDASTLYAKSMLDGISAVVFAAGMGVGVALSAVSILLYQGSITLLAQTFGSVLPPTAITELTATGGLLIVAVSMRIMEVRPLRVANLLPAIPIAATAAMIIG